MRYKIEFMTKAIGPFKQLLTFSGLPLKGTLQDEQLEVLENVGILLSENGRISRILPFKELVDSCAKENIPLERLEGDFVAMPGMIDAHTHICWGGTRARDYAMRVAGKPYLEIAKAGGGIWDSVQKTRAASEAELTQKVVQRANKLLQNGTTTIEVKTGYGLTVADELKMLYAIRAANANVAADLVATCLPAHIVPKDFDGDGMAYVEHLLQDFFPKVQAEQLSTRADIFVEESAFNHTEARKYLAGVQAMGFDITIHADQFTAGSSLLGVEFKAISVDHLEASTDKEVAALAQSDVIPVALPGASLGLGCAFTPARKLLDAGTSLAIATDWNPGSAPMGDLLTQAAVFGAFEKLSMAETLAGVTFRAAAALNLQDRGQLVTGKLADIVAFPTNDYREILYYQGQLRPSMVWKSGKKC